MRKLLSTLSMLILFSPLSAIGFGYHVFEIRTEPEFGKGVFPTSVMYQFNFPVPDFIAGNKTELAFRLDNGLVYRTLRQDPVSGAIMGEDPSSYDFPKEYTVHFDEFNLFFAQGFIDTSFSDNDLLTAFVSIDGRFEMAFERLSWMTNTNETEGVFWDSDGNYRFPENTEWIGAPELSGDRSSLQTSISLGLMFDYMRDTVTMRDGIKGKFVWRFAPEWMLLTDGTASFVLSWNEVQLSKTLFSVPHSDERTWFSIVLDDYLTYRWIYGSKVPQYVQGGDIWGPDVPNARNVITNRIALTFYGPQILSRDTYPSITIFWDMGRALGKVLNSASGESINESVGSYGIRANLVIAGIAEFFYEIGCSYDPVFAEDMFVEQKFGFSVGV